VINKNFPIISGSARVFNKESAKEVGLSDDEFVETIQINAEAKCPVCGAKLVHESGCVTCYNCEWSACE